MQPPADHQVGGREAQEAAVDPMRVVTLSEATFDPQTSSRLNAAKLKGGTSTRPLTRGMEVHVVNHGFFRHEVRLKELAARIPGFIWVSPPGLELVRTPAKKNVPWHSLTQSEKDNMPDGYLKGFDYEAFTLRMYFQLGKMVDLPTPPYSPISLMVGNFLRRLVGRGPKKYIYDRFANTNIEVTVTVWFFKQTNAFETKATFRVMSRPLSDKSGHYGINGPQFVAHQRAMVKFSDDFFAALNATPPDKESIALLDFWGWPGSKNPKHPTGNIPLPGDDEKELENEDTKKGEDDHDPHVDPTTSSGAPGVPSGELNTGGTSVGTDGGDLDPTVPVSTVTPSPTGPVLTPDSLMARSGADLLGSLSDDKAVAPPVEPAKGSSTPTKVVVVEIDIPRF
jgi:hypothetical protein